jgi:rubrerythrin
VSASMSRGRLLTRSAVGGAALLVGGSAVTQLVDVASADPLPGTDLAYARLLVGAELLAADFYSQAVAAANSGPSVAWYLKRALANEKDHYASVAQILSGAGLTPAVASDIDFSYPAGTFASQGSIVKFAKQLEETVLGTYLGALDGIQTSSLKGAIARIAACEAQHAAYFTTVLGGKTFGDSFPPALPIDQASNALDAYTA